MQRVIFIILVLAFSHMSYSQEDFYDINTIREVRIYFKQSNWDYILDSLKDSEDKILCDVSLDGKYFKNVGIRYKGYSSWNINTVKNSFNIYLDYLVKNKNYMGVRKIKLNNTIHDPSFVREILSYKIASQYMPVSKANYAKVYANDTLIGLYANVESVDKNFVEKYYGDKSNTFYKGEPVTFENPFGENSNLAYTHGTKAEDYVKYYQLESDDEYKGRQDIFNLIYTLNKQFDSIESILNVDRVLWMHAFNYLLVNLDSYIAFAHNYYMCMDVNGRFNPILWDMNQSFGSFRNSDGSYNFKGLTIDAIETLDPFQHLNFSISPRPLLKNILSDTLYQKMYIAHIRTIIKENFANNKYINDAKLLQDFIDSSVKEDTNKFYSYTEFHDNLYNTVGGHDSMIEYPGIASLMTARVNYLNSLPGMQPAPTIININHTPKFPSKDEFVSVQVKTINANKVTLAYRCSSSSVFQKEQMFDDGEHNDESAGDGIFGLNIQSLGNTIQYYIYAENDTALIFSPERASTEYYSILPAVNKGAVVINELNITDSISWIELCNTTSENINLKETSISSSENISQQWVFPDTTILAKSYLVIYANNSSISSNLNTSISLSFECGKINLFNQKGNNIEAVKYGLQSEKKSYGRFPNGYGEFIFMQPTLAKSNLMSSYQDDILLYPNPASEFINVELNNISSDFLVEIYDTNGCVFFEKQYDYNGSKLIKIDVSYLNVGLYVLKIICNDKLSTQKLIIN